jgi:hypothetical protein
MEKILLSSGCSFSFEDWNWPGHLSKKLNYNLSNVAMPSQGNGIISRKVIYNVEKLLKNYKNKDILVGVMWSGVDRFDYYSETNDSVYHWGNFQIPDRRIKNPTNIVDDLYNWRIMNHHWTNKESKIYYQTFHTTVSSMIFTIEHILRTQWYLERLGINYFMSTFMDLFNDFDLINHPEILYLYKQIDFTKFLPVKGCYEWVKDNYRILGFNSPDENNYIGTHPTSFGHEKFTDEVILPYLNKNI